MTNRVGNAASAVALPLATETAIVTVTPAAPSNQVAAPLPGVLVRAVLCITGAASATNCAIKLRRGAGLGGTDILASDAVVTVPASAIDNDIEVYAVETVANFNAANGIYTVTGNAAGAAQTARLAWIEVQPLSAGV